MATVQVERAPPTTGLPVIGRMGADDDEESGASSSVDSSSVCSLVIRRTRYARCSPIQRGKRRSKNGGDGGDDLDDLMDIISCETVTSSKSTRVVASVDSAYESTSVEKYSIDKHLPDRHLAAPQTSTTLLTPTSSDEGGADDDDDDVEMVETPPSAATTDNSCSATILTPLSEPWHAVDYSFSSSSAKTTMRRRSGDGDLLLLDEEDELMELDEAETAAFLVSLSSRGGSASSIVGGAVDEPDPDLIRAWINSLPPVDQLPRK